MPDLAGAVFDAIADATLVVDERGLIRLINRQAVETFGYAPEEVLGRNVAILIPAEIALRHDSFLERYRAVGSEAFPDTGRDVHGRTKDSRIIPLWLRVSMLRMQNGQRYFVASLRDVSERQRAADALRTSEEQHRLAHQIARLGYWRMIPGPDGRWESAVSELSAATADIIGLPKEKITLGEHEFIDRFVVMEDRALVKRANDRVFDPALGSSDIEYRIRRPDGKIIHVHEMTKTQFDGNGRALSVAGTMQDITERKRIEAGMKEANDFLRGFMDNTPVTMSVKDKSGRYLVINKAGEQSFRRPGAEILGRRIDELSSQGAQEMIAMEHEVLATGRTLAREISFSDLGSFYIVKFPIRAADGAITAIGGCSIDIRERKQIQLAMEALSHDLIALEGPAYFAEATRRLASLLGVEYVFITRLDPAKSGELRTLAFFEGGTLLPNFSYAIAGTPSESLLAGQSRFIVEDAYRHYPADAYLAERKIEAYASELLRDHAGRPLGHLVAMSRSPFKNPAIVPTILQMFAVASAAAINREQIHRRDAWLRAIFLNAPMEVVIKDLDLSILAASRNVVEGRGTTMEDVIGRSTRDFFAPEIAEFYEAADRKVIETGEAVVQEVREVEQGRARYFHSAKFPLRDAGGQIMGICSITTDVTETKEVERRLAQAVKMEAIGKLTGGMAHDFNNYLGVIIGNLDLLKENELSNPASVRLIESALKGAMRSAELTRSLLAFSRQQPLDPQIVDVNRRLLADIGILGRTLGEDITLDSALASGLWPVRIDGVQLDSCVLNLANNARDAMPNGGRLSIATRNITLAAQTPDNPGEIAPGDYVLISVADTGSGMAPETVARAFDPFFTTKGPGHGTGLGLSMVYGFVKQSGGHVRIMSELDRGTIVQIYLPRHAGVENVAGDDAPGGPGNARGMKTETILVVEDNEQMRQTAMAQLRQLGYRPLEAENGAAALAIIERKDQPLDLLFTDIVMPGKPDGYELARLAGKARPGLKVLLTSGFSGGVMRGEGGDTPDFRMLRKPYRLDELAHALEEILRLTPAG